MAPNSLIARYYSSYYDDDYAYRGLSTGAIIGIVVALVAIKVAIIVAVCVLCRRRDRRRRAMRAANPLYMAPGYVPNQQGQHAPPAGHGPAQYTGYYNPPAGAPPMGGQHNGVTGGLAEPKPVHASGGYQ